MLVLTITIIMYGKTETFEESPLKDRKYVFLTGRVHPGETNSSHIMHGLIQFLLSSDDIAANLRKKCIFKIVPMINPDGVVNGRSANINLILTGEVHKLNVIFFSHRCSLAGVDLNRQWKTPSVSNTPTIFWTKLLYRYLFKLGKGPVVSRCLDFPGRRT